MTSLRIQAAAVLALAAPALAAGDGEPDVLRDARTDEEIVDQLTELSLEELLDLEVVTVSRRPELVSRSPAAVYVIGSEDIRRSGLTSLPEILRLAPGMHVARINSNSWAVAARGFNGRFNNKMLVMIDGRTVFTNLFSGVFWDVQDLHLEDIERIEVIRGPGPVWGANAVNGVVNIITKNAGETQGAEYSLLLGNEDELIASRRYGATLGESGHWRSYAKWTLRDSSEAPSGSDHFDDWGTVRGGFRMDWEGEQRDRFTLQGDAYEGRLREESTVKRNTPPPDEIFRGRVDVAGGNVLGRWTRELDDGDQSELQVYYDVTRRRSALYDDQRDTLDVDWQYRTSSGAHEVLFGLGYRWIASEFHGSASFDLDQSTRNDQLFSAFVQDELTVAEEARVVVGAKVEHNDLTGFEFQPWIRGQWTPGEDQTLWAAVSRVVRTPSVVQHDLIHEVAESVGPSTTVTTTLFGDDNLGSDEMIAYEIGWRRRLTTNLYFDLTAFYNDFEAADNFTVGTTVDLGGGDFLVPVFFDNSRSAEAFGVELAADLDVSDRWKVRGGLSYLDLRFDGDAISTPIQPRSDDEEPNLIGNLRSHFTLTEQTELDVSFYAVDGLDDLGVPGYLRVDVRFGYRPSEALELSVGGWNVNDAEHPEFGSALLSTATEIERAVYFKVLWRP